MVATGQQDGEIYSFIKSRLNHKFLLSLSLFWSSSVQAGQKFEALELND